MYVLCSGVGEFDIKHGMIPAKEVSEHGTSGMRGNGTQGAPLSQVGQMGQVGQVGPMGQVGEVGQGHADSDECPYLLLDVRDADEYDKCHILTGASLLPSPPPLHPTHSLTLLPLHSLLLNYRDAMHDIFDIFS